MYFMSNVTHTAKPQLSPSRLNHMRSRLREEHEGTSLLVLSLSKQLEALFTSRGGGPGSVENDWDGQTIAFQSSETATMLAQARSHLSQIDAAINRIENGTYGVCVDCGDEIPYGRLEVLPHASRCVRDAAKVGR
jgi:DnaK suppressor protein